MKLRTLSLAACLMACQTEDNPEMVPVDSQSAALDASQHARAHLGALVALSQDFRAAEWLPADLDTDAVRAMEVDPDAGDEIADALAELLDERYVESKAEHEVIYLLDPVAVCGEGEEAADCVELLTKVPLRVRVTSPAVGDVNLELLVGESRENPVDVWLHADQLAVSLDLGEAADSVVLVAEAMDEAPPAIEASGVIRVSAERQGPQAYVVQTAVDRALSLVIEQEGERAHLSLKPSTVALLLAGGDAPSAILDIAVGALNVAVPGSFLGGEDCEFECSPAPEGTIALALPGVDGQLVMEDPKALSVRDLGFAGPLVAAFDGEALYTVDPNPSRNGIDLLASADNDALDLRFDHAVSLLAEVDTDVLAKLDDEIEPEGVKALTVNLTGDAPHLQLGEQLAVLAGSLRIELPDGEVLEADVGMCVADTEDGPAVAMCR